MAKVTMTDRGKEVEVEIEGNGKGMLTLYLAHPVREEKGLSRLKLVCGQAEAQSLQALIGIATKK